MNGKDSFSIRRSEVQVTVFPAGRFAEELNCGFYFREKVEISCSLEALQQLVCAARELDSAKEVVRVGRWVLKQAFRENHFSVQIDGCIIYVEPTEFREFIELVRELSLHDDVRGFLS